MSNSIDLCTTDTSLKKKSFLAPPRILPKLIRPVLHCSPNVQKSNSLSQADQHLQPATITRVRGSIVPAADNALKAKVSSIPMKEANIEPEKAILRFLPEPVEYYSWKPEGTYTDYDGKLWYLPNNVEFSDWVNREFVKIFDQKFYKETEIGVDRPPLFNYQQFIKSFFTPASPYRGILLNHHMGSGKSRTAIVTAEQFRMAGYKMIFMLPASLRDNAIAEIRLWGNSDLCYPANYGSLSENEQIRITNELNNKIRKAYNFVSYNSSRVLKDLAKLNLENCCIVIDEVHDLVNTMANEAGKTGKMIYEYFMRARNCRFIAMSGTPPPINYPFELGLLFNILRGPIPQPNDNRNKTYSVGKVGGLQTLSSLAQKEEEDRMYGPSSRLTAYPEDKIPFDDLYVDYKTKKLKNEGLFRSRGVGLTSFFHGANRDLYPAVIKLPLFKLEMDQVQFEGYMKARTDEIIRESKRSGRLMGPNTFRPNSRQFCNFGMPPQIDRPISLSKFKQITFNNPRLNSYESLWTEEQKNELEDLFYSLYEVRNDSDYSDLGDNSTMTSEGIQDHDEPSIESHMDQPDTSQAINVFEVLRDQSEKQVERIRKTFRTRWASFKDQHARLQYLIKLIDEAGRVGIYSHIVSRNEEVAVLQPDQNHNSVELALSQLSGPYKNYLLEDLGKTSQKHKKMHENIESGPGHEGPIFVYSSFRTMEGIEIFSRELDVRGYRKFDPNKDLIQTRESEDDDAIESRPKLYAILSGAESIELRTQILNFFNHPRNIRGAYLKILLGTSASAQGLSLLNCRQVHIMEPWWTLVLILQVIGRVCRIRSHHALPVDERNVYVYEYLSTISKDQSKLIHNEELSTDEYLYLKAIEKDELNQQFYVLLKEIAIDVVISGKENRPLENGLRSTMGSGYVQKEDAPYSLWRRDNTSGKKPKYNYMPNVFDECIEFGETTLSILGSTSNSSTQNSQETVSTSNTQLIKTVKIDRKYVAVSVSGEKYIYFLDDKDKPEITKKLFQGEKIPIKVIELYDFRSMKYSQSCVLRAYVDEAGKKRELDMVKH